MWNTPFLFPSILAILCEKYVRPLIPFINFAFFSALFICQNVIPCSHAKRREIINK